MVNFFSQNKIEAVLNQKGENNMKQKLAIFAIPLSTLFAGCGIEFYDPGVYRDMTMNIFLDQFRPLLDARYMTGAEATVEVSQGKCVSLSRHDIRAPNISGGADDLAGRIGNAGGNAYVLNGFQWSGYEDGFGNTLQLNLSASSFLCD